MCCPHSVLLHNIKLKKEINLLFSWDRYHRHWEVWKPPRTDHTSLAEKKKVKESTKHAQEYIYRICIRSTKVRGKKGGNESCHLQKKRRKSSFFDACVCLCVLEESARCSQKACITCFSLFIASHGSCGCLHLVLRRLRTYTNAARASCKMAEPHLCLFCPIIDALTQQRVTEFFTCPCTSKGVCFLHASLGIENVGKWLARVSQTTRESQRSGSSRKEIQFCVQGRILLALLFFPVSNEAKMQTWCHMT